MKRSDPIVKSCADLIRVGKINSLREIFFHLGIPECAKFLGTGVERINRLANEPGKMRIGEFFKLVELLGVGRAKLLEVVEPED